MSGLLGGPAALHYPTRSTQVFDGASQGDTYDLQLSGQASLRLSLAGSGVTEVSIKLEGYVAGTSAARVLPLIGAEASTWGQRLTRMTGYGLYFVDVSGLERVKFTVETLNEEASLSVVAASSALLSPPSDAVTLSGVADVSQQSAHVEPVSILSEAVATDSADVDTEGHASLILYVSGSSSTEPFRISLEGQRAGGGSARAPIIARALGGDEAGVPVTEITQRANYALDVTGLDRVRLTVEEIAGSSLNVTGALSPVPHVAPAPPVRQFTLQNASGGPYNVRGASTLRAQVMEQVDGSPGLRVEGRPRGTTDWALLPAIGPGREMVPWNVGRPGLWEWDIRGVDEVKVTRNSSSNYYLAHFTVSQDAPTPPVPATDYGLRRFTRITADDGNVNGSFFALRALSDCTLSSAIRFLPEYPGQPSGELSAGLEDTDQLAQGDILYGPFGRVAVLSGTLLAYHL